MARLTRAAIALGSNLGDREGHLQFAVSRLEILLSDLRVSTFYDTTAASAFPQPRFLNAAAIGLTALAARPLLDELLAIERERGRTRSYPDASRTLDLDLVLFGEAGISEPGLVVPHPRFRERVFVLAPLAEIAPEWVDPVTGLTIGQLLAALQPRITGGA